MKYQSELIKEIVDTRGHKESSLHYESECVETWIEEAKGAYPKLCDYEGEWLNYISILDDTGGSEDPEPPIGEFPYIVLSDVTDATVDNVVPYAYKTAILKGQTLVNIKGKESNELSMPGYSKHDFLIPLVKKNTDYLIKYDTTLTGGVLAVGFLKDGSSWSNNLEKQPNIGLIRLNSGKYPNYFRITADKGQTVSINNLIIVEYQDGMENWDIPYLEGMQSVEMPVLTTSNGDGTKTNILTVNEDVTLRSNGSVYDELDLLTGKLTQRIGEDGVVLSQEVIKTVDLTITNQDGETLNKFKPLEGTMHLSTSSKTIAPLFSGEIPVEAITQNLASFIDLETEE